LQLAFGANMIHRVQLRVNDNGQHIEEFLQFTRKHAFSVGCVSVQTLCIIRPFLISASDWREHSASSFDHFSSG